MVEFGKKLTGTFTPIPGMVLYDLPVHGDNRGWFKENWQRDKMVALGLPDFGPVQNNISFNTATGTTRGIHAEPWDKFVSVATGRIFGAWVDLREGASFGAIFTAELDPSRAVFVPRGVGNAFQTLVKDTVYSYLVNDHWTADAQDQYTFLNLADETVDIRWPIPLAKAELSEKDRVHPRLLEVTPMPAKRVLILGANGQVGRALAALLPDALAVDRSDFDIADPGAYESFDWRSFGTVINAAAYTAVDLAETPEGRRAAWLINVTAIALLARVATEHRLTLVHISSDYVFDGANETHAEDEAFSPLGVYGQTKAAADAVVTTVPRHYIVRTSWVIGDGNNFVRTMVALADRGVSPSVVNDQYGRLSFADDIAAGIMHLVGSDAAFGVYNLSNAGPVMTWADVARDVFRTIGADVGRITGVSTEEYFAGRPAAPRPRNSVLVLAKIEASGYEPRDSRVALSEYIGRERR